MLNETQDKEAFVKGFAACDAICESLNPTFEFGNKWSSGKWYDVKDKLGAKQHAYSEYADELDGYSKDYANKRVEGLRTSINRANKYYDRARRKEARRYADDYARRNMRDTDDETR